MFKLSFRPSASNDVQEIVNYYDKLEIRLADVFLKELEDTLKHEICRLTTLTFPKGISSARHLINYGFIYTRRTYSIS